MVRISLIVVMGCEIGKLISIPKGSIKCDVFGVLLLRYEISIPIGSINVAPNNCNMQDDCQFQFRKVLLNSIL